MKRTTLTLLITIIAGIGFSLADDFSYELLENDTLVISVTKEGCRVSYK